MLVVLLGLASLIQPEQAARAQEQVPVVDVFLIDIPVDDGASVARFEGALHGAYRVPGGTILYWSLREGADTDVGLQTALEYDDIDLIGGVLADPASLDVLLPLREGGSCLCTQAHDLDPRVDSHRFQVMYTTFPPISTAVDVIDVDVDGRGTIIAGVPITDTLPAGPRLNDPHTTMGLGWPSPPTVETIEAFPPQDPMDLVGRSSDLEGSMTTEGTGTDRLVRFDADVLFDFDKSNLNSQAQAVLDRAVAELERNGATTIEIIGHTDGWGTEDYNQDLSERRAETVAQVLQEGLGEMVEITTEGRGWHEPIATNGTDEGRAQNRRVTITYATDGGQR